MKKILLFAAVLLLLSVAIPKAIAQFNVTRDIRKFAQDPNCDNITHPLQEIRAIYLDVCGKPEKNWTNVIKFTAPKIKFSREAMIFNTVNFVIASYDNRIDALRNWKLQINFGDGGNWATVPKDGITLTITYPLGSSPILQYKGAIDPLNPVAQDDNFTKIGEKPLFIKNPTKAYTTPDKIWKINAGKYTPPYYASQSYAAGDPALAISDPCWAECQIVQKRITNKKTL